MTCKDCKNYYVDGMNYSGCNSEKGEFEYFAIEPLGKDEAEKECKYFDVATKGGGENEKQENS